MVLHVISLHCMVLHGIVLYSFFCTVSHYHVQLLQRAGELPRSASSHFSSENCEPCKTIESSKNSKPIKMNESSKMSENSEPRETKVQALY